MSHRQGKGVMRALGLLVHATGLMNKSPNFWFNKNKFTKGGGGSRAPIWMQEKMGPETEQTMGKGNPIRIILTELQESQF